MDIITLTQLTITLQTTINAKHYKQEFWVEAEVNNFKGIYYNTHCYFELVDRKPDGKISSKASAVIWKSTANLVKKKIEDAGLSLKNGAKTVFKLFIEYHIEFGLKLIINDVSVKYLRGSLEDQKEAIRKQLKSKNLFDKNKKQSLPLLIKNIALITSVGSRAYNDIMITSQIHNSKFNYNFLTKHSSVQGQNAVKEILDALNGFRNELNHIDVVVIARGGGSQVELETFNDYSIAETICNFPKPVLTGIAHEGDKFIADEVAFYCSNTPTGVINYINDHTTALYDNLLSLETIILDRPYSIISNINFNIQEYTKQLFLTQYKLSYINDNLNKYKNFVLNSRNKLLEILNQINIFKSKIYAKVNYVFKLKHLNIKQFETASLINTQSQLKYKSKNIDLFNEKIIERGKTKHQQLCMNINSIENEINFKNPENLLKMGYSLTLFNGKPVKDINNIQVGNEITTRLLNGKVLSKISIIDKEQV